LNLGWRQTGELDGIVFLVIDVHFSHAILPSMGVRSARHRE
jgi:hypothetical protein